MTHIFTPKPEDSAKWRAQAARAAKHMKRTAFEKAEIKLGFVFDDGIITVKISSVKVKEFDEKTLADLIYNLVIDAAIGKTKGSA